MVELISKNKWMLLPAAPGTCSECAVKHEPWLPHNKNSLFYQMKFSTEHGRSATWDDAMSHCTEEMKTSWKETMERVKKNTDALGAK